MHFPFDAGTQLLLSPLHQVLRSVFTNLKSARNVRACFTIAKSQFERQPGSGTEMLYAITERFNQCFAIVVSSPLGPTPVQLLDVFHDQHLSRSAM